MSVSFGGFNANTATFKIGSTIAAGTPVEMDGGGKVKASADGKAFCGIAAASDDAYASVQLSGAVTVKCSGTAPAAGYAKLASDGKGVKADTTNGREYLVLEVDSTAGTVTFLL